MKRWPEISAIAALVATLSAAVTLQGNAAQQGPDEPAPATDGNSFAIRGVRVFDGERVVDKANVVVRDGRIAAVGADAAIPKGLATIDGSGKTLLPGLIDAHVHAWGTAQEDALRFGVTTAIDMHGDTARLPALRQQRESLARTAQADLWAAGTAVTVPGGHGTQYGFSIPTIDATTDIPKFVGDRVGEGADFIKVIIEDLGTFNMATKWPTLTPAHIKAVIASAHAAERKVVVHVSAQADALQAADAGADGLAHIFVDAPASDAFVATARKHAMFVIPTLSVVASEAGAGEGAKIAADARLKPYLGAEQGAGLAGRFPMPARVQYLDNAIASVRKLHAAGVPILAGTDAPNPGTAHGASMHGELVLLTRAGLTPLQALAAATAAPAKHFGMADRGRIATGLRADLVLVDGDPTADITATRDIDEVWKNGHAIERATAAAAPTAQAVSDETLVSDFDGAGIDARFGSGWQPTTDQMAGGASTVAHALVSGGAAGSKGALEVSGEIKPGFAYPWSGVMFFPASQPMQPVDLSKRKELLFQVRGDGRQYTAMLFSGASAQGLPAMQAFNAGKDWQEVRLPLSGFQGADLARVRGIGLTAGQPVGTFRFQIDHVEVR